MRFFNLWYRFTSQREVLPVDPTIYDHPRTSRKVPDEPPRFVSSTVLNREAAMDDNFSYSDFGQHYAGKGDFQDCSSIPCIVARLARFATHRPSKWRRLSYLIFACLESHLVAPPPRISAGRMRPALFPHRRTTISRRGNNNERSSAGAETHSIIPRSARSSAETCSGAGDPGPRSSENASPPHTAPDRSWKSRESR